MADVSFNLSITDRHLIAALKRNARLSISELAASLAVSRATVRARMERLVNAGQIRGFTILTAADVDHAPVRGLMMLSIEGAGSDRVIRDLMRLPEVVHVHSTNGKWDLIAELATDSLAMLDQVLAEIRRFSGVRGSETNLLLSTRRGSRV
jgi:DNA-binding Lrp family transcriptional regulator